MRLPGCLIVLLLSMMKVSAGERPLPLDASFLRDYAETRRFRLGLPTSPQVTPDGDAVLFLRAGPRSAKQGLFLFDTAARTERELISVEALTGAKSEDLSPAEKARRERMRVSVGGFTSFQLSEDGDKILVPLGSRLFLIERATLKTRELRLAGDAFDPKISPDGRRVGFVRNHDVWVYDLERDRERRLTRGGTEVLSHGEAEFVAAEEMYRYTGWWWAPDSRAVAYQETDATGVEQWYVADPAHPERAPRAQFYPRPGKTNVRVRLGVVGIRGGRTRWVKWDSERYPYLTRVNWHREGGLTLGLQTRDQRELILVSVDPRTGVASQLLSETDRAWVNLDPDVPRWLEDGSAFLWTTEHRGAWQLELRNRDGSLLRVLTEPEMGYQGLVHIDNDGGNVVFAASENPRETHLWIVPLAGGEPQRLTVDTGIHEAVFARKAPMWVHTSSTPDRMPYSVVRHLNEAEFSPLQSVAVDPGFVPHAEIVVTETDPSFHAEIIRPSDFAAGRRYPVLLDVYGGPHANVVQSAMNTRLLAQWLADQGFIVVSIDNRGTPHRGREWERAIHLQFVEVPLQDQVMGLNELGRQFPELDLQRVGVVGWSFGGYLSALAVLRRPDVFKAAVAGAPVTDWLDYDTHYTERYLGVPGDGDEVYAANSLIDLAPGLERPLLLIHGTSDDNVFFRHSLKLAEALFRAGREFDILPLPGLTHMVPDPVIMERQWLLTVRFFRQHLGTPAER
jgi:dipeptidyl-peptidase-4